MYLNAIDCDFEVRSGNDLKVVRLTLICLHALVISVCSPFKGKIAYWEQFISKSNIISNQ